MLETKSALADRPAVLTDICGELRRRQTFLITSHARPDGDSIGSQLAMAYGLRSLGKRVRVVNRDPAPPHYLAFPGVDGIEIAESVSGVFDALIVMECSDLSRTGLSGLERYFAINIDHHVGNTHYGALNWFDPTAAACGEMVFELIAALGVRLTREIATHVYLAILTDTGSFHHSNITGRTFDICRQTVEAGVDPAAMARSVFDSNSFGKLRLIGALLNSMQVSADGRVAVLYLDDETLRAAGCTYNDTEGLINLPLTASEIQAVVFFKVFSGEIRVSLRSKGDVDVREVARFYGGGGHKNAAGFTVVGGLDEVRGPILARVIDALEAAIERGVDVRRT
jgi:phosphoesterase RecJ-like protein